jgi:NTP pyrophosphatase (non-canonical NTP hydrolase)
MDLKELADEVHVFISEHGGYWDLGWMLAALTEELGELSRSIQDYAGLRGSKLRNEGSDSIQDIEEECGDLLFALLCITNSLNINLENALLKTLKKYKQKNSTFYDAES